MGRDETEQRAIFIINFSLATRTAAQLSAGVASFAAAAEPIPATSQAAVSISSNSATEASGAPNEHLASPASPLAPSKQPEESAVVEVQDIVS